MGSTVRLAVTSPALTALWAALAAEKVGMERREAEAEAEASGKAYDDAAQALSECLAFCDVWPLCAA